MERTIARLSSAFTKADRRLSVYAAILGTGLALLAGAAVVIVNVSAGPLSNLNDIGGWRNRLLFLLLCGAAQVLVQLLCVFLRPSSCGRMLLRQVLLLCGFHIALLAINQKTYVYTAQVQPLIRAAETGGLAAIADTKTALSVPYLSLLFLLTRIPVYDLYLVKLLSVISYQALTLLFVHSTEELLPGLRSEALLLLSQILPHAFLSVACAAQADIFSLFLLFVGLLCQKRREPMRAAALYGLASSLCGVLLLSAPLFFLCRSACGLSETEEAGGDLNGPKWLRRKLVLKTVGIAMVFYFIPMLPAILAGFPAGKAICSPLTALFGAPPYASGSCNLMALFPRASAMEMPEIFLLRRVPALDLETNASPFYTSAHFEMLMRGLALTGMAGFIAAAVYVKKRFYGLRLAFLLAAMALFAVPGGSAALWLSCDLLALCLILTDRQMRIPSCILLFATAAGACYPVTEEILIRPAYTSMMIIASILLSLHPLGKGEEAA